MNNKVKYVYTLINTILLLCLKYNTVFASSKSRRSTYKSNNTNYEVEFEVYLVLAACLLVVLILVKICMELYTILNKNFKRKEKYYLRKMKRLCKKGKEYWEYKYVVSRASNIYYQYCEAWSNGSLSPVRYYMDKYYFGICEEKMEKIKSKGKVSLFNNVQLKKINVVSMESSQYRDVINLKIHGSRIDIIVNEDELSFLRDDYISKDFVEILTLKYDKDKWILTNIDSNVLYN